MIGWKKFNENRETIKKENIYAREKSININQTMTRNMTEVKLQCNVHCFPVDYNFKSLASGPQWCIAAISGLKHSNPLSLSLSIQKCLRGLVTN